jgi:tetratricopeptide (TPR) repeat protein/predicted Ser/Thr protein kinase
MPDRGEEQHATDFLIGGSRREAVPRIEGVVLSERIGEGAFGVVWRGEQVDPVRRPVAVKFLRIGTAGRDAVRRFESEKAVLARLDHPGVARILDAGEAEDGSPYIVMEFIDGTPFDRWRVVASPDLRATIGILVEVARAVGAAHRQGVVHRDLKPANVLVRRREGGAGFEAKVIDFGVARIVGDDAQRTATIERGLATTPAYMSPELAEGEAPVDGRTDVWSLGVMLFEALAGRRPFGSAREGIAGALELQRQILSGEVPPLAASLAPDAPRALRSAVADDLAFIVDRALAPDREARYRSPDDLADDLDRWLRGEPVEARPADAWYRVRKFVGRNRLAVGAAAALVFVAVAATAMVLRASGESAREAERWREIARLNRSMLTAVDPAVAQGLDPRLMQLVIDEAEAALATDVRDALVEAEIRATLGSARAATGDFDAALAQFARVREIRLAAGESEDGESVREVDVARGHALVGAGRFEEAGPVLGRIAEGSDLLAADALQNLSVVARAGGDPPRARVLLERALALRAASGRGRDAATLAAEQELAIVLSELGEYERARPLAESLLDEKLRVLGARHPDTLRARTNLAEVRLALGEAGAARAILEGELGVFDEVLGSMHVDTLSARNNLAGALRALGAIDDAIALYDGNLEAFRERHGADDARTILAALNLASALSERALEGAAAERAEAIHRGLAVSARAALGASHQLVLANDANYGAFLVDRGRHAEAEVLLERTVPVLEDRLGPCHPRTVAARTALVVARIGVGRVAALAVPVEALRACESSPPSPAIWRRALEAGRDACRVLGDETAARWFEERLRASMDDGPADL